MRYPGSSLPAILLLSGALACSSRARATPPEALVPRATSQRAAAAEALFAAGRRLLDQGRYAEACAKFAESQRLDHGVGTLLNLADCYERNGQTASAWAEFRAAAEAARAEGQRDRERVAREREQALAPALVKLTIALPKENRVPGLRVTRDDMAVAPDQWGVAVPIDPGEHLIAAAAPGKRTWARTVFVPPKAGAVMAIAIPKLSDPPPGVLTADDARRPDPDAGASAGRAQRIAGVVLGSAGVAGLLTGAALGVTAIVKNGQSDDHCRVDLCDPTGVELRNNARAMGTASTVALVASGVVLVGGVTLYLTAPRQHTALATVRPVAGGAGVLVGTTW